MKAVVDNGGDGAWVEVADWARLPKEPVVSVAMLAYNHERYLAEAIEGVMMQEAGFPFELVLGVDLSTDGTLAVARAAQARHPGRIRVLEARERLGMHRNCFGTLSNCRGRYTAFCEGDDFWIDSGKLELQVGVLETDPGVEGCFHDCEILVEASGARRRRIGGRSIDRRPGVASIIREKNITTCSMLYRNRVAIADLEVLGRGVVQLDYLICLLVAERGRWQYLPEVMAVYRSHEEGVWGGATSVQRGVRDVEFFRLLHGLPRFGEFQPLIRSAIRARRRTLCGALAREGRPVAALVEYLGSFGDKRGFEDSAVPVTSLARGLAGGLVRRFFIRRG